VISVLVTGATTPIGERLVRNLVADTRVRHVLAVGHEPPNRALPFSSGRRLTYMQIDLRSSRRVRELLFGPAKELGCEVVVHLSQHRSAFASAQSAYALNVESTRSILDLADRHPSIRRFVLRSFAEVYKVGLDLPTLITEDHPLNLDGDTPQYVRDRVEADLTACARMGLADCEIVVLRTAEALGPATGSQLYDFLQAPVCFRPMGFDPMVNVATTEDVVAAIELATHGSGEGVFNVPGYDTLPLSEAIRLWGTPCVPAPGPLIRPLYSLRHAITRSDFRYGINRKRMHYGLVLDGNRAREVLGYVPKNPVPWPRRDG
jgi:UDP-glucose 4-epimerase